MNDTSEVPGWGQSGGGARPPWEAPPGFDVAPTGAASPIAGGSAVGAAPLMGAPAPKLAPVPVPELPVATAIAAASDHRPEVGPMYPDLFSQAMAGSSLANVVTVNYADGEPRPGLDVPVSMGFADEQPLDEQVLVSASARVPAEIGAFTGASARKRWRILR